jgi:hypothetical protein
MNMESPVLRQTLWVTEYFLGYISVAQAIATPGTSNLW